MNSEFKYRHYLITIIAAFCSIVYEFTFAQLLSAILGDTLLRFNTTIGIYICSLGLGALFFSKKLEHISSLNSLIKLEIILPCFGVSAYFGIIFLDSYLPYTLISFFSYFSIFIIGFLSGIELPLLIRIATEKNIGSYNRILGLDYLGTFLGIIYFSFYALLSLGLFKIAIYNSLGNLILALILICYNLKDSIKLLPICLICISILITCSIYHLEIETFFVNSLFTKVSDLGVH